MNWSLLNHGSGGKSTMIELKKYLQGDSRSLTPFTDSAILTASGVVLAFTTDSYVVDPLFFPGGNIGKLAVMRHS